MSGLSYFESSKLSYYLLIRNDRRFSYIRNVGGLYFTISKIYLCLLSSLICYFIIIKCSPYNEKVPDDSIVVMVMIIFYFLKKYKYIYIFIKNIAFYYSFIYYCFFLCRSI